MNFHHFDLFHSVGGDKKNKQVEDEVFILMRSHEQTSADERAQGHST